MCSSSNLCHSEEHNSSDQEVKFVYATKATHRYQKHEASPKVQEVGVLSTLVNLFYKGHSRAMEVQP